MDQHGHSLENVYQWSEEFLSHLNLYVPNIILSLNCNKVKMQKSFIA